jgi:hypothetical protein
MQKLEIQNGFRTQRNGVKIGNLGVATDYSKSMMVASPEKIRMTKIF